MLWPKPTDQRDHPVAGITRHRDVNLTQPGRAHKHPSERLVPALDGCATRIAEATATP